MGRERYSGGRSRGGGSGVGRRTGGNGGGNDGGRDEIEGVAAAADSASGRGNRGGTPDEAVLWRRAGNCSQWKPT